MKIQNKQFSFIMGLGILLMPILFLLSCEADLEVERSYNEIVGEQPTISSFSPESSPVLGTVTVTGTALNFVEKAFINGVETPIHQRINSTEIIIEVGVEVSSGPIKLVTGAEKEAVSEASLTVTYPTPSVTSDIPTSSTVNENITLEGENLNTITKVTFGGVGGIIEFKEENAIVVKTPLNMDSPMELAIHYNTNSGEKTTVLESNFTIHIPQPQVDNPPRLMTRDNPVTVIGENMNLVTSVSVGGEEVTIDDATATSLTFSVPSSLVTGYYNITFDHSEDQQVTLEGIPYINGEFINLLDFDDYPIDIVNFVPEPITATQQYNGTVPQPPFPPNSENYYNVVYHGYTGSSVAEFKLNDIPANEAPLSTVLDDGSFNNTPYLHFWYNTDDVSTLKIYMGGQRRELQSSVRSTDGEWVLVAVLLKDFISTATDLSEQLDIILAPTSTTSAPEIKESNVDWFIITDKVLTEFGAEDWSGDDYWKAEG